MTQPSASASVSIAASPQAVYDLITDLGAMAELTEETAAMRWSKGDRAAPGAVFKGTNRHGLRRWTTTCTITDAEPGRRFAFEVAYFGIPIAHWAYDLAADGAGCTVTESTWDRRPGWFKGVGGLATGAMDRAAANRAHITATLQRLKARFEASGSPAR